MGRRVDIFFSYAHEDESLMDDVRRQFIVFDRQEIIRKWHDRQIPPGTEWRGEIDRRLQDSQIILLFISPHFFESDYCYDAEMTEAMRRHQEGAAKVIPIILRPCAWEDAPFAQLQALPADGKAVTLWPNRDEACLDVARGVMRAVGELRGENWIAEHHGRVIEDVDRILQVRVHRAFFVGRPMEHYFVNITNLSASRAVEVTHVWYEDEANHIAVQQAARPLPVRLDLDESWETWIEVGAIPARHRDDAAACFRARISTGKVFRSTENPDVPPTGSVPGGRTR